MTKLRFAPIIRVSTEAQDKQHGSLETQTEQIKHYVESMNGEIPDHCWKYTGQEHATSGWERTLLDQLLKDAEKDLFDAVIVVEPSRWSRDNLKSEKGLEILKKNKIKFYVGTMEYNLYDPVPMFYLTMTTAIGALQANTQALKSIQGRISRAKKGIPTAGKLPYGRLYDKETMKWSIDKEKQAIVKQAAKRYLAGENMVHIGRDFGMSYTQLYRTLTITAGTDWPCHFKNEKVNIDEIVPMEVPPLLDEATIKAIHERRDKNITYVRGHRKYDWLLNGFVYCGECGYAFTGTPNRKKVLYYRHSNNGEGSAKCGPKSSIRAKELEDAVMMELLKAFGDVERIKKAVEKATPNKEKREGFEIEQITLTNELKSIEPKKQKIVKAVEDEILTNDDVKKRMTELRERESSIKTRLSIIDVELESMADPEKAKRVSKMAMMVINQMTMDNPKYILAKSFEWKRKLLETLLSGKDFEGKSLGVYVTQTGNKAQPWQFEIRGALDNIVIDLPLSDEYLANTFGLDSDYCDVREELNNLRIKNGWH